MDAPIGYLASLKNHCEKFPDLEFSDYWDADSKAEVHHFIGKDIINFHALFWPAVLEAAEFRKPTKIHTHGFLTVNGVKMSKSRGTFIAARKYIEILKPEYLRYYLAAKLNGSVDDVDFNLKDFVLRVNSDLVGKVINIASRCAGFIEKSFENTLSAEIDDQPLLDNFQKRADLIASYYEQNDTSKAIREVMALADLANQYIAEKEPWTAIKDQSRIDEVHKVCSLGVNLFRILIIYLKPILPDIAAKSETFLNCSNMRWEDIADPLVNHKLEKFKPMLSRLENKTVQKLITDNAMPSDNQKQKNKDNKEPQEGFIDIKDFSKIEMKVAKVLVAKPVEGADKLLQLELDVGEEKSRTVFSGIKSVYSPEELEGRLLIVVANLTPRKMRFGISEGMVLAAGQGENDIFLLSADSGALPGMIVT